MPAPRQSLVLASGSPRRRELLQQMGVAFEVLPANIDESVQPGESPVDYVVRMAREKAEEVARQRPQRLVLAADTSVILGNEILGKPTDAADAARMLRSLSGQSHRVLTAMALEGLSRAQRVVETTVHFNVLTEVQIRWYLDTKEPFDKAGAYAVQGLGALFLRRLEGSPSNVVGLPVAELTQLLIEVGWPVAWATQG